MDYQVIARKYRPQCFADVLGQDAVVTTLRRALEQKRTHHAYLLSGIRGSGKTTLARLLAKALNCLDSKGCEPCGQCASCREISAGTSLDVLEVDGASNRGIDDIRQITETVHFSTATGGYKIFIIDEVHMLTKDAFNALLKTLEEPPPNVRFIFATTEPHKVLPTIASRCQRFHLARIPQNLIAEKLRKEATDLGADIDEAALMRLAKMAEGSMRDAESSLDLVLAYASGNAQGRITEGVVAEALGHVSTERLQELDKAAKEGKLDFALTLAEEVYSKGMNLQYFVDSLMEHFRLHLLAAMENKPGLSYNQDECLHLLDYLSQEAPEQLRRASHARTALEMVLLRILRIHQRQPVSALLTKLDQLAAQLKNQPVAMPAAAPKPQAAPVATAKPLPPIQDDPEPSFKDVGKATPPVDAAEIKLKQGLYDTVMQFAARELHAPLRNRRTLK